MEQHSNLTNGPVIRQSARERGGFRSLIRNRGVQAFLACTLAAQTVAVVTRHEQGPSAKPAPSITAAPALMSAFTTPAADSKGPAGKVAELKLESPAPAELAAEYRENGYPVTDELAETIVEHATANGISAELAFGLVATESEFKRTAKSPVGAIGLAQLMPATAVLLEKGTTAEDLKDPETNLRIGFRYLGELIDRYDGDTALALTAYNRGTGTVDRILDKGGDPDNGYAGKVMGDHVLAD